MADPQLNQINTNIHSINVRLSHIDSDLKNIVVAINALSATIAEAAKKLERQ